MPIISKGSYINASTGIRLHRTVQIAAVLVIAGSVGGEADGLGTHWPSAAAAAAVVCDSGVAVFEFDAAAS